MKTLFFFLLLGMASASTSSHEAERYVYNFSISKIEFTMKKTLLSPYKVNINSDIYTQGNANNIELFNSFAKTYNGKSCNPATFEIQILFKKPFYSYYYYKYRIEDILESQKYTEKRNPSLYAVGGVFYQKNNTVLATLFHKVSPNIFVWTACTLR